MTLTLFVLVTLTTKLTSIAMAEAVLSNIYEQFSKQHTGTSGSIMGVSCRFIGLSMMGRTG